MAAATKQFCVEVIDAVADLVAIVKPQAAFFELLGPYGMQCLAEVMQYAHHRGLLVLLDAKRGDIGTTAEAYAQAYLGTDSAWGGDALTVNPFLGDDTLVPFVSRASATGTGLFVLVKTSNPGSSYLQDLSCPEGHVYDRLAGTVQKLAHDSCGSSGYGAIGAVTGATYPEELARLRSQMPSAWLLIPGYGAQGAGASEVAAGFDDQGMGAIVNSSRGIIFAYGAPSAAGPNWQDSVRQAAEIMRAELPKPHA
jgi:orotidine-5'-phosphate decarboxylase